jgi:O-antigen/teichoic acid export membrane protein
VLISLIKKQLKNEIVKTGLIFGTSTFIKLLSGLIIAKLIVLSVGLSGFGVISQFQSLMNILMVFAGGGISNGVMKYVAEYRNTDLNELNLILKTSTFISILFGLLIGFILIIFSKDISIYLFQTSKYFNIIIILAFFQFFIGFNNFFQSIINGYREVKSFAVSSVLGSFVGLIFVYFLSTNRNISSLMIGQVLFGFFSGFFCFFFLINKGYFKTLTFQPLFYSNKSRLLFKYTLMLLVTISTLPFVQILIRNLIGTKFGWDSVGKWQGVMKISDAYLQFITIILANYFFPKLAELKSKVLIRNEVFKTLTFIVPITILISICIFIFKNNLILMLYSHSFLGIDDFFTFQLIGDVFKVAAYTIIFVAAAKGLTFVYILAEIFQSLCLLLFSYFFIDIYGPIGVTYSYALTYFVYLIFSLVFLYIFLKTNFFERKIKLW